MVTINICTAKDTVKVFSRSSASLWQTENKINMKEAKNCFIFKWECVVFCFYMRCYTLTLKPSGVRV